MYACDRDCYGNHSSIQRVQSHLRSSCQRLGLMLPGLQLAAQLMPSGQSESSTTRALNITGLPGHRQSCYASVQRGERSSLIAGQVTACSSQLTTSRSAMVHVSHYQASANPT